MLRPEKWQKAANESEVFNSILDELRNNEAARDQLRREAWEYTKNNKARVAGRFTASGATTFGLTKLAARAGVGSVGAAAGFGLTLAAAAGDVKQAISNGVTDFSGLAGAGVGGNTGGPR